MDAPVDWVWKFLLNAEQMVANLPGARLDGRDAAGEEEETFSGAIAFKVGVLNVELAGKATLSELDYYEHSFKLTASGDDPGGEGAAKVVLACKLVPINAEGIEDPAEAEAAEQCAASIEAEGELSGSLSRIDRVLLGDACKGLLTTLLDTLRAHMADAKAAIARESLRSELDSLRAVLSESEAEMQALRNAAEQAGASDDPAQAAGSLAESGDKKSTKKRRSSSANLPLAPLVPMPSTSLSSPLRVLYGMRDRIQALGRRVMAHLRELIDGSLRRLLRRSS